MRVVGDAGNGEGTNKGNKSYMYNGTLELYWIDHTVSTVAIAAESKRHLFEGHVSQYKKLT